MYFWNIKALALKLKEDQVSDAEKFKYFAAFVLFNSLCLVVFSSSAGAAETWLGWLEFLSVAAIILTGLVLSYRVNREGDNRDFIGRFVCLSLPVTIRLLVLSLLLQGVYAIFSPTLDWDARFLDWGMNIFFTSLYYGWIYIYIKHISKR